MNDAAFQLYLSLFCYFSLYFCLLNIENMKILMIIALTVTVSIYIFFYKHKEITKCVIVRLIVFCFSQQIIRSFYKIFEKRKELFIIQLKLM